MDEKEFACLSKGFLIIWKAYCEERCGCQPPDDLRVVLVNNTDPQTKADS